MDGVPHAGSSNKDATGASKLAQSEATFKIDAAGLSPVTNSSTQHPRAWSFDSLAAYALAHSLNGLFVCLSFVHSHTHYTVHPRLSASNGLQIALQMESCCQESSQLDTMFLKAYSLSSCTIIPAVKDLPT